MSEKKDLWICCDAMQPILVSFDKDKDYLVGRHKECVIQLPHSCVSRRHALFKVVNKNFLTVKDLNSSNGTFVNGRKVKKDLTLLKVGDVVGIGPFEIEIKKDPFKDMGSVYGATNTDFMTASKAAAMTGQIEKTPLIEVLQSIEFNEKTGTLYVENKTLEGFLVFISGKPISAQFGEKLEIPAILEMLSIKRGSFVLTDKVEPIEMGINTSFTNILLEYSRIQDEVSV